MRSLTRRTSARSKFFLLDEAWLFIKNETIRNYVVQAQKTWRKHHSRDDPGDAIHQRT